jgi:hypothetical protein
LFLPVYNTKLAATGHKTVARLSSGGNMTDVKASRVQHLAQDTTTSADGLLQQALSVFDMPLLQPVAPAFPAVISDAVSPTGDIDTVDVNQLFAQQERLLFGANPVPDSQASADAAPAAAISAQDLSATAAELQAIQQMYKGS